jgi:hypothetical protein
MWSWQVQANMSSGWVTGVLFNAREHRFRRSKVPEGIGIESHVAYGSWLLVLPSHYNGESHLLHPHALAQPSRDLLLDCLIDRFSCSARNQRGLRGWPKPRGFCPRRGEHDWSDLTVNFWLGTLRCDFLTWTLRCDLFDGVDCSRKCSP